MEVNPARQGGSAGIQLSLRIPNASLTFVKRGAGFEASFEITVTANEADRNTLAFEKTWQESIVVSGYDLTRVFTGEVFDRSFMIPPGEYLVTVRVLDLNSNAHASQQYGVRFPDIISHPLSVGGIRLGRAGKAGTIAPMPGFELTAGADSVFVTLPFYLSDLPCQVGAGFLFAKLHSDTAAAQPPFAFTGTNSYRLSNDVDYEKLDTIAVAEKVVTLSTADSTLAFLLPRLVPGVYMASVDISIASLKVPDPMRSRQVREFLVRKRTFPRPTTLDELVDPLIYIAKEDEFNGIREASTPGDRRGRFDAFWLGLLKDESLASNTIKQYYTRVQDANMFFTTYKEGWRTDRGMVYVVLGPPAMIENLIDRQVWTYPYTDRDNPNLFVFQRVRPGDQNFLLEDFVLDRQSIYDRIWTRAIDLWRHGRAF